MQTHQGHIMYLIEPTFQVKLFEMNVKLIKVSFIFSL